MITLALRAPPPLASIVRFTRPLPVPVAPLVTVIQVAPVIAVHGHPGLVVTSTVAVPPDEGAECCVALNVYEQLTGGAAACVIEYVWSATTTTPTREGPSLGAIVSVTVPSPLPTAPEVTTIHGAWLVATHGHWVGPLTSSVSVPPAATIVWLRLLSVSTHVGDVGEAPFWLTVTGRSAILNVPTRAPLSLLAALKRSVPGPTPPPLPTIDSHGASLEAVHSQPASVLTFTAPSPPPTAMVTAAGSRA